MRLIYDGEARVELVEAFQYYEARRPGMGRVFAPAKTAFSPPKNAGGGYFERQGAFMPLKPPGGFISIAFRCARAAIISDLSARLVANLVAFGIASRKIEVFAWLIDDAASGVAVVLAFILLFFIIVFVARLEWRLSLQALALFTLAMLCTTELARF